MGTVKGYADPNGPAGRGARFGVDPRDQRPATAFHAGRVSTLAIVIGALTMLGSHIFLAVVLLVVTAFSLDQSARAEQAREMFEEQPPEVEFVEAKLIKLGRQFDPHELPNRIREARTTAPPQPSDIPRQGADRVRRPDAGPLDSVNDLVARLGTRADELAHIAQAAEQEGDPDGVAEGTVDRDEGDVYRTYLYGYFRRGFTMPTSITDEERHGLAATVRVQTSPAGIIEGFTIASASGNSDFDQAVRLRMDQAVGSQLRDPPDEERNTYFGTSFPIRFSPPR